MHPDSAKTHLNHVEGVEGMHTARARAAKELDGDTVEATIHAILTTEFALAVLGEDPTAFQPDYLFEIYPSFGHPLQ